VKTEQKSIKKCQIYVILPDSLRFVTSELKYSENYIYRWSRNGYRFKTLVDSNDRRILIDCGLFQGVKPIRELNWQPLQVSPSTIECVLLTNGHLDHCGWLPLLVNQGFSGKIYCSNPTMAIAKLILMDSAKIQEEEAKK
jgi:Cft2 family RNA processing exonuclease